ncbi:hypothetical protein CPT_Stills46 [Bacillus phage Stills]|uniref:Uncharacterized protein n=1 Tax=Bacillus phage Stills TaxID=1610833 RepID=A0A0E3T6B4_9CAUD|nr:hypothetical protein CPT_Stills46 [Bacillus phage Stills]AKC02674.1 hypothetical protein CPT_Stills46 [Bacillus phage Stills]
MAKVNKFASKVKKLKRTGKVHFNTDEGEVLEFAIESRKSEDIDTINGIYDAKKPKVPTRKLPSAKGFKVVEQHDDPEYKKELGVIQRRNLAHLALMFLAEDERPEGEVEEQVQQILDIELAGFIGKIVNKGLEISGLGGDDEEEELVEVKND